MIQLPTIKTAISANDHGSTCAVVQRKRASTTAIERKPTPTSSREPFVSLINRQWAT